MFIFTQYNTISIYLHNLKARIMKGNKALETLTLFVKPTRLPSILGYFVSLLFAVDNGFVINQRQALSLSL